MEKNIIDRFRDSVKTHRDSLLAILSINSPTKNICLGNCGVDEVSNLIHEHDGVLERIDQGEFGKCAECEGEVEIDRLEHDFTTKVCLDHYSDTQLQVLERDLELAAKVQKQLLPQELPLLPGIQIAAHTEPAHIVSGDYFDFYEYPDNSQGIAVADVMGKGLPASMLMSRLQAFLRILGPEQSDLHSLATRLNELLRYNLTLIRFISLFLIRLDMKVKKLHYCNAGHNPGIWWNTDTNSIQLLKPTGPAIGLSHTAEFSSKTIQLNSGDLVVIYTDGIIEARDENNEEFGQQRLENFVKENKNKSAKEFLSDFRKSFKEFTKNIQDDITLLVLKVL
ncbi:MAG: serine/threonine-protein phosphatase [Ignavibacteria bacterium]|nr:serine/threonine-protein phosphatase [Ignavibacteria bacterium]